MTPKDIVHLAMKWSNGDPDLFAEMVVTMDTLLRTEREACAQLADKRKAQSRNALVRCPLAIVAADIRPTMQPRNHKDDL
jgi:hypothetical protein